MTDYSEFLPPDRPTRKTHTKKIKNPKSEELKILEQLHHQRKAAMSSMKPEYIPMTRFSDDSANELTNAVICYINLIGGWATKISVEGRYIEKIGKRVTSSVKKGTADIHACLKGKHLSIEVKYGKDRQSDHQKEVERDIKAAEGYYYIARDFASFFQWINQEFGITYTHSRYAS